MQPGTRIGPYEITGLLGAGGMGEVYRAVDTRLKREVALKILPDSFASDSERLARFQREAEVLASLNHKNIAGIYEVEGTGRSVPALVLELVEGETLADRIKRGPLPFEDVLTIGVQIAEAFEAAHDHGVIHRDLKPANVKIRPDGTVKVLDFGLAKLIDMPATQGGGSSSATMSPTITSPALATGVGTLLGTAAYMSPEQAKGRAADKRSDVWAFGCVLFEMATGRRAFEGEDVSETIASVLRGAPDWTALPAGLPGSFARVLRRCLERDRTRRLRDIGDARIELQDLAAGGEPAPALVSAPATSGLRVVPLLATALVTALVVALAFQALSPSADATIQRFNIVLPSGENFSNTGRNVVAIDPRGRYLVYGGGNRLNLQPFDQLKAVPVRGSESGGRSPFVSPDGEWIGFWAGGSIFKVGRSGGAPVKLAGADIPTGITWSTDGTILYGQDSRGILRVSSEGGTPETVVTIAEGELAHGPQLLPGGEWILFALRTAGSDWDDSTILAQSLRSSERRVVVRGGREARYLSTGHLVYAQRGTVYGIGFDLDRVQTVGGAIPLLEGVPDGGTTSGASHFSVADNGTLAYVSRLGATHGTPVWVDREGREVPAVKTAPLENVEHPRLSPDGRRLVMRVASDIWVYDLEGRPPIRLTQEATYYSPLWTADGRRLIYESVTPSPLLSRNADGAGEPPIAVTPPGHFHPLAVTPDGRELIVVSVDNQTAGNDTDIHVVPLTEAPATRPFVKTPRREGFEGAAISPNGRWFAYASDATGQLEIWVQPYGTAGSPVRVSPNGGIEPVWSRNGRELFYLEGRKLMAVPVETAGPRFDFMPARMLFETDNAITGQPPSYDVGPDGRFIMIRPTDTQREASPIVVVLNWFEELKQRVPLR
jgi:serine/threonine-protein kinase